MKIFREFLNESSMTGLLSHTKKYQCGTISACTKEGCSNHKKLADELSRLGLGFITIIGGYKYKDSSVVDKEKSYFVVDWKGTQKLKEVLIKLGQKYNQETITFANPDSDFYMINCGSKKEKKLGKPYFKVEDFKRSKGNFSSKNNDHFIFAESESTFEINLETLELTNNRPNSLLVYDDYIKEQTDLYKNKELIINQMTFSKHKNVDLI